MVVASEEGIQELSGLTRRFGNLVALDDLSFTVTSGGVTGFLEPNGAGKTTTMRAIFGLTQLDRCDARWNSATVGRHNAGGSVTCPRNAACTRRCSSVSKSSIWVACAG